MQLTALIFKYIGWGGGFIFSFLFIRSCKNIRKKCSFIRLKIYFFYEWLKCFEMQVIQNRYNGSVDFDRDWKEYTYGFGSVDTEYWIGKREFLVDYSYLLAACDL